MRMCGSKVQLTTYIDLDLFKRIEAERTKTNESQSGIIASVLDACFRDPI
jgi:hypothetical protein